MDKYRRDKTFIDIQTPARGVPHITVKTEDAYMYEDKEGVRIIFNDNIQDKIDILPHSLHIWYEFTEPVTEFCDWLLENVYLMKK